MIIYSKTHLRCPHFRNVTIQEDKIIEYQNCLPRLTYISQLKEFPTWEVWKFQDEMHFLPI